MCLLVNFGLIFTMQGRLDTSACHCRRQDQVPLSRLTHGTASSLTASFFVIGERNKLGTTGRFVSRKPVNRRPNPHGQQKSPRLIIACIPPCSNPPLAKAGAA